MHCPFCGAVDSKVIDSRLTVDGEQVRRRRECLECSERFTTYETAELSLPRVIKSDKSREVFSELKLRTGLSRALEKRPVAMDQVEAAIARIKHRAQAAGERELSSHTLGLWVMDELRKLDQVAYIRFASVYLSFEDLQAYRETIENLEREPPPEALRRQVPLLGDDES